jgi:hypothetical protein
VTVRSLVAYPGWQSQFDPSKSARGGDNITTVWIGSDWNQNMKVSCSDVPCSRICTRGRAVLCRDWSIFFFWTALFGIQWSTLNFRKMNKAIETDGTIIWHSIHWPSPGGLSFEQKGHKPSNLGARFCHMFLLLWQSPRRPRLQCHPFSDSPQAGLVITEKISPGKSY